MNKALWLLVVMASGAAAGLALTYAAVHSAEGIGTVRAGGWTLRPGIGSPAADPYSRARMARRGDIPMSAAEGVVLVATRDSAGQPFSAACSYIIEGPVPPSNHWTLTLHGTPAAGDMRIAYTSIEALSGEDGTVRVALSPDPQAGNWIPLRGSGGFELHLRLYETQVSASAGIVERASVPVIRRERCQ